MPALVYHLFIRNEHLMAMQTWIIVCLIGAVTVGTLLLYNTGGDMLAITYLGLVGVFGLPWWLCYMMTTKTDDDGKGRRPDGRSGSKSKPCGAHQCPVHHVHMDVGDET